MQKNIFLRYLRPCLLLGFIMIMILRAPNLLIAPRFWAEEGIVYFKFAWEHRLIESLFHVAWNLGYLNFFANLAAVIASRLAPLEYAPHLTTYLALVIQTIPLLIVLFSRSNFFNTIAKRAAMCSIFVLAPCISGEMWLNTINSQIYFGLIALLILLEDLETLSRLRKWIYRSLLAVGGLTGVYVAFLAPVFVYRFFLDRKRERRIHLLIVCLGLFVQSALACAAMISKELTSARGGVTLDLQTLAGISLNYLGIPCFGQKYALKFAYFMWPLGGHIFLVLFLSAILFLFMGRARDRHGLKDSSSVLLLALLIFAVIIPIVSLKGSSGGRYGVLPGFITLLFLLDNVQINRRPIISTILVGLLFVSLVVGFVNYREGDIWLWCDGASPHPWSAEIALWRQNPNHAIRICPSGPFKILLKPRK